MENIVSNRKSIDIDTLETVDKYIDGICENPDFLCRSDYNKKMCGTNTSIYANLENVENICRGIQEANVCEDDIKECVVSVKNSIDNSSSYVTTSFLNVIIPIPNAYDKDGNIKFIRLPALSSTKKKNSNEICSVCACMDRFATSPGSGFNDYTSPRQNKCVYLDKFEYYYYPLYVEQIRNKLTDVKLLVNEKYNVVNSNIIRITTENDLNAPNLYTILIKNGISEKVTNGFINLIYKNNEQALKDLKIFLSNKGSVKSSFGLSNQRSVKSSFGLTNDNSKLLMGVGILILLYFYFFYRKQNSFGKRRK
jgi:hypothetical protein